MVKTTSGKNVILKVVPHQNDSEVSIKNFSRKGNNKIYQTPKTFLLKTAQLIKQDHNTTQCEILKGGIVEEVADETQIKYEQEDEEVEQVEYCEDVETEEVEVEEQNVIEEGTFLNEQLFENAIVTKSFDEEVFVNEVTLEDNVNEVTIEGEVTVEAPQNNEDEEEHEEVVDLLQ